MGLIRTGYEQHFEDICIGNPTLGRVCIVPWDTETFGFRVAAYQIGADQLDQNSRDELAERLASWAGQNQVSLCFCTIPAANRFWKCYLPEMGFGFVDFGLRASLNGLQNIHLPEARTQLRIARREDWEAVEAIAAQSFQHGRYHADPVFPVELADLRYRHWVRRALAGQNGSDRVYVMGDSGSVQGFYHVTIEGPASDLRLAAVTPELRGTLLGFDLYVSVLHLLKGLGIERIVTSISGANTPVMNVYSMLGFHFSEPEAIYHWHAEGMDWGAGK